MRNDGNVVSSLAPPPDPPEARPPLNTREIPLTAGVEEEEEDQGYVLEEDDDEVSEEEEEDEGPLAHSTDDDY